MRIWPLPFLAPRADFSRVQQRPESKSGFGPTPEAAVTGAIDYSRRQPLGERAHRGLACRRGSELCVEVNERFDSLFFVEFLKHRISVAQIREHFICLPSKGLHRKF